MGMGNVTMRIIRKLILHSPIPFLLIFTTCDDLLDDNIDDSREPVVIFLKTDVDTLLLLANNTYKLSVEGIFTETSENTVNNSGVFANTPELFTVFSDVSVKIPSTDNL